ncbi:MAG: WD40 repeat domain-containing protein [Lacunisphaera sp.]
MSILPVGRILLLVGGQLAALIAVNGAPIDVTLPMVAIESALADPTGKYIALGGTDGSVVLLNASDGTAVNQWPANGANQITKLAFSADGTELLTVSPNRVIRILDTQSPQAERARWNPSEYFPGADLTPDGKHALIVTHDGPIRWFDVATKHPVTEWRDATQPHGYAYARLLTDDGLAVVAPINGDGALVDAASGRVLARLSLRGVATAPISDASEIVTLPLEGGVAAWKREALFEAAKLANPTAIVQGWMMPVGGPVGRAAQISAPASNWIFWNKNVSLPGLAWAEPSWDTHPFFGFMRPVVLDWPRRRMWFVSSKGHFQGWSWDELGQPDALAIAPYLKPPTQVGASLVALEGVGDFQLFVDWREMAPVHVGTDSRSAMPNAVMEKAFQTEVVSGTGVVGSWKLDLDPFGGWKITWHGAEQRSTAAALLGFRGTRPSVSVSPRGLTAVYSSAPGMIVLGPNNVPPTQLGLSGVNITVPAIRLLEPGAPRPLGAFDDHRAIGVIDVRWASNSRWIATRDYDGSGNAANALRVYSVPEGKRAGSAHSANRPGDFAVADDGSLVWSDGDGTVQVCRPGNKPETILGPAAWSRSARVAFSPSGELVALLTGTDEVVVVQVATHQELRRVKLPGGRGLGWEEPQGGLLFVSPTTILVAHGHSATLRKISL